MNTPQTNTESKPFLFQKPEAEPGLSDLNNLVIAMGALASRLTQELRTRTIHPDGRRENVAEHSFMLAKVSIYVAQQFYPDLDIGKVAFYSINHDDVEAYVGDTPTDKMAQHDPELKKIIEAQGEAQLSKEYHEVAPGYVENVQTYEEQEEREAQFVRIMDKFMVLLIQIPNDGAVWREHYTYDRVEKETYEAQETLLAQYPDWSELISLRTELALHLADKYLRPSEQPDQQS